MFTLFLISENKISYNINENPTRNKEQKQAVEIINNKNNGSLIYRKYQVKKTNNSGIFQSIYLSSLST